MEWFVTQEINIKMSNSTTTVCSELSRKCKRSQDCSEDSLQSKWAQTGFSKSKAGLMTSAAHVNVDITKAHEVLFTGRQKWKHSHEADDEQDGWNAVVVAAASSTPPLSQFYILTTWKTGKSSSEKNTNKEKPEWLIIDN